MSYFPFTFLTIIYIIVGRYERVRFRTTKNFLDEFRLDFSLKKKKKSIFYTFNSSFFIIFRRTFINNPKILVTRLVAYVLNNIAGAIELVTDVRIREFDGE